MDYYLQFESEAAANAVLFTQEPTEWDEEGNATAWEPRQSYRNIDTIGVIYKPTGEMLQGEDGPYPATAPIEGWHVNVRLVGGENGAVLDSYKVNPSTPMRVWG